MINKLAGILVLLFISSQAYSQTETQPQPRPKSSRPDIPGTFTLELGFNSALNPPDYFSTQVLGSRTINIYYQYDFRIANSKFFFSPGIGLSLERFKFKNNGIVVYPDGNRDSVLLVGQSRLGITGVKKSALVTNFIEVPLEFKFLTNPDDPNRSFRFSLGGRIGYLYDSFAKYKYREGGEMNLMKEKHNFNLNRFRYGVFSKFGIGNFAFFGYYNINTLFETDKGMWTKGSDREPVNFNTWTVGISLSSF